jgi:hypothetical protein
MYCLPSPFSGAGVRSQAETKCAMPPVNVGGPSIHRLVAPTPWNSLCAAGLAFSISAAISRRIAAGALNATQMVPRQAPSRRVRPRQGRWRRTPPRETWLPISQIDRARQRGEPTRC